MLLAEVVSFAIDAVVQKKFLLFVCLERSPSSKVDRNSNQSVPPNHNNSSQEWGNNDAFDIFRMLRDDDALLIYRCDLQDLIDYRIEGKSTPPFVHL